MKIEITKETAKAIIKMNDRYFFNLFVMICKNDDEEYEFRNAITAIAREARKSVRS